MSRQRRSILLTGATGFIGSCVAQALRTSGHEVLILKRKTSDTRRIAHLLADSANVTAYDIESNPLSRVFENHRPHAVIHMATVYGRSGESLSDVIAGNLALPVFLLEAALAAGTSLFLNADSFSARGNSLPRGLESYVMTKRQFRQAAELLSRDGAIRFINAQIEHPYGPRDRAGKFVPALIGALLRNSATFEMTPGQQCRDFVFVDDVADAFVALVERADALSAEVQTVEIGSGASMPLREFVTLVKDLVGASTELKFGALPYRPDELMHSVADLSAMFALGWSPKTGLQDGLLKTIESARR